MNQSKSQDLLAKLLSNENITVTRGRVRTASFDIKNRVLTLPRWKDMTPAVEEMLMLHEVGHALYTGVDAYSVVFEKKAHLKDYANVIEDVRIEKKMKDRYPGSRKSFNIGYNELIEKDFFGVRKNQDKLDQMLLIDRINIFYKVGYNSGVSFNTLEQDFIRRIDLCNTEEEVIALAEEIYAHSQQEAADEMFNQQVSLDIESDEEDESDDQYDQSQSSQTEDKEDTQEEAKSKNTPKVDLSELDDSQKQKLEEAIKSKTVDEFEDKLSETADTELEYFYYDLKFEFMRKDDLIIPYKRVISEITEQIGDEALKNRRQKFQEFKANSAPMINYLIKEFEMRKSATAYKRNKVSRLGQLDPRKLYAYKIKEDLFKQITTVQDGKKHGMIFLLDWSGSMSSYMEETVEQVINLAMFCQRSQITYQVFAFTDGYDYDNRYNINPGKVINPRGIDSQYSFNLLELFSSKMSGVEFNTQMELLLARPYKRGKYKLNGTPLNQALLYMTEYVGKFKRENQVEKLSFISLTDGESNTLSSSRGIKNGHTYDYDDNHMYRRINAKSVVRDEITKKEYDLTQNQSEQTSMLLNVIRDRYDVTSIGFFIMDSKARAASTFVRHNVTDNARLRLQVRDHIVESMRKNSYAILNSIDGRDEYYIIPSNQKVEALDISKVEVDESDSAATIARQLTKVMTTQKQSRIVLNSFIKQVA